MGTGLEPGEEGAPAEGEGRPGQPSLLPSQGVFPWKNSEGHQRDQMLARWGSQEHLAVTLEGVPAPCAISAGAEDPRDQLEGRGRLGRNLLENGGFMAASRSRAPCQGRAPAPCSRGRGQDRGDGGLHIPARHTAAISLRPRIPSTGSAPVDSRHGFRARGFPARLLCRSLSPFPKPGAEQWAKAEGYLLTDNLPT